MEKVSDKWFKQHGWTKQDIKDIDSDGTISHSVIYQLNNGKLHARYDMVYEIYPPKWKGDKKGISRYYMFYASGSTGFRVENKISHRNFTTDSIVSALRLVGYDEFGHWIDK